MVTDRGEIREKLKEMIMDRICYDREMTDQRTVLCDQAAGYPAGADG